MLRPYCPNRPGGCYSSRQSAVGRANHSKGFSNQSCSPTGDCYTFSLHLLQNISEVIQIVTSAIMTLILRARKYELCHLLLTNCN